MIGYKFWRGYLMLFGDGMIVMGLVMLYLPFAGPMGWLNEMVLGTLSASGDVSAEASKLYSFAFGLAGSATVGWGIVVFALAWKPLNGREFWAWLTLAASAGVWFILDTIHVLQFGATPLAVLNGVLIAALAIALLATYRDCRWQSGSLAPAAG